MAPKPSSSWIQINPPGSQYESHARPPLPERRLISYPDTIQFISRNNRLQFSTRSAPAAARFRPRFVRVLKVFGTHNSYHRRTNIPSIGDMFPYDFQSIVEQLDAGVRHLELDVHYDWKTGRLLTHDVTEYFAASCT